MIDSNIPLTPAGPNRSHNGTCLVRAQDVEVVALERSGGQQIVSTSNTGAIAAVSPLGPVLEGPTYAACVDDYLKLISITKLELVTDTNNKSTASFNLSSSIMAARGATKLQTQQYALPLSLESCQQFSLGLLHVPNEATAASPTKVCFALFRFDVRSIFAIAQTIHLIFLPFLRSGFDNVIDWFSDGATN